MHKGEGGGGNGDGGGGEGEGGGGEGDGGGCVFTNYLLARSLAYLLACLLTVRHLPIEIDAKEAVSRFLNVHGKPGGQSVNF